jgi:hypothetical protein
MQNKAMHCNSQGRKARSRCTWRIVTPSSIRHRESSEDCSGVKVMEGSSDTSIYSVLVTGGVTELRRRPSAVSIGLQKKMLAYRGCAKAT